MRNEESKKIIDRAYEFDEEQQKLLDEGKITEDEWYETKKQFFTTKYLSSDNPRGQSGHSSDEFQYFHSHMMILEAIHKKGSFIDVGCANGYLLESLNRWSRALNYYEVEFYGLDISEGLIQKAQERLPQWKEKLIIGNAFIWKPEKKFEFVLVKELGYVPTNNQKEFLEHMVNNYVVSGGRFIFGPYIEERGISEREAMLSNWGYKPTGYIEKSHDKHKDFSRKLLWLDIV